MKKIIGLLSVAFFSIAVLAFVVCLRSSVS